MEAEAVEIQDVRERRLHRLAPLFKVIAAKLEKRVNEQLRQYDVTFAQINVIILLFRSERENYSMKELEGIFQVSQQTAAGIIKRLEKKKLLVSYLDTRDKRVKRVCLSEQGRQLGEEASSELQKNEEWLENSVTQEERRVLVSLLRRVYDYLG